MRLDHLGGFIQCLGLTDADIPRATGIIGTAAGGQREGREYDGYRAAALHDHIFFSAALVASSAALLAASVAAGAASDAAALSAATGVASSSTALTASSAGISTLSACAASLALSDLPQAASASEAAAVTASTANFYIGNPLC
jgi:hypothetical protein